MLFLFNAIIIIAAGYVYGWEKALYTLVTLYVSTRIIDAIHTRHVKITALIVTKKWCRRTKGDSLTISERDYNYTCNRCLHK
ncbi:YitT family protein [Bacillus toyonensis]